ncbi:hypothetical protein GGS20DRAFT_440103 [Poronia punctata]|nr:hypothetical protein GGS20DRAFT_440103 [Poronia punctata]
MLANSESDAPPAASFYFDPPDEHQPLTKPSPRSFKKHKVLPRPRTDPAPSDSASSNSLASPNLSSFHADSTTPSSAPATPPRIRRDSDICTIGPDLPPTPPAHSRGSPDMRSIPDSNTTSAENPTPGTVAAGSSTSVPGTPTLQKSPPTPDVTPPQINRRPKPFRPILADRIPSGATGESRTESFITARESPGASEEEDRATPRPPPISTSTSQSTEKPRANTTPRKSNDVGLGLGFDMEDKLTPRYKEEFTTFDGEWMSNCEVEQEWDDNLDRNVTVRKRRANPSRTGRIEVIEDATVSPTNATKALRSVSLHERMQAAPPPQHLPLEFTQRRKSRHTASTSGSSISTDVRRSSGMSSKSTVSTIVEAILVDVPPQRQKTLRHVKKQNTLRESGSERPPLSSTSTSTSMRLSEKPRPFSRMPGNTPMSRTGSVASAGTVNSVASRKARREVWRSGGIPVVVIPGRVDSLQSRSSGPPSLRTTHSHRSKRSISLGAVPRWSHGAAKDTGSYGERPARRGRSVSVSDSMFQLDQLTMDYPPIVPRRTSSLSAPTSRNTSRAGSRAGSLTAESLKAHNSLVEQLGQGPSPPPPLPPLPLTVKGEYNPPSQDTNVGSDSRKLQSPPSGELHRNDAGNQKSLVDHNGDPFFGKRLTAHNTPFSQASVETNGTHSVADIAEAMAVNIYSHQNRSVLMIHHMSKPVSVITTNEEQQEKTVQHQHQHQPQPQPQPSTGSSDTRQTPEKPGNPEITTSGPDGGPVTPPQPQYSMDDVDSPLRNPREPPKPPALKFIPATPSGLTPAAEREKMLGNFFEETQKRPSLVRRAFSLRKSSDNSVPRRPSLLSRTLSLSRTSRAEEVVDDAKPEEDATTPVPQYPTADDTPADESKLHPFWRPAYEEDTDSDDSVCDCHRLEDEDHYDDFPSLDHQAAAPRRRSLTERMRRTFAILPLDDTDRYITTDRRSPERRTIKRTPSGNLRVMPHRGSLSSVRFSGLYLRDGDEERPSSAPEGSHRRVWGVEKRVDDRGRRLFPNWQDKLDQYRPQNLQRRLSEHRRQKRTEALRQKISGPREVRDGVGEVVKRNSYKGISYQTDSRIYASENQQSLP